MVTDVPDTTRRYVVYKSSSHSFISFVFSVHPWEARDWEVIRLFHAEIADMQQSTAVMPLAEAEQQAAGWTTKKLLQYYKNINVTPPINQSVVVTPFITFDQEHCSNWSMHRKRVGTGRLDIGSVFTQRKRIEPYIHGRLGTEKM